MRLSKRETNMSQKHPPRLHKKAAAKRRQKVAAEKVARKDRRVELRQSREKQQ
jgi:hypothetical protein